MVAPCPHGPPGSFAARSFLSLALLRAPPNRKGHVRGLVVRRSLRHASSCSNLPVPFGRWGFQRAAPACGNERRLRGGGVIYCRATSTPSRRPWSSCSLDVPRAGREGRAYYACDRRRHAARPCTRAARPEPADAEHAPPRSGGSPVMPVSFFLSSIAADRTRDPRSRLWIAKGWRRPLVITIAPGSDRLCVPGAPCLPRIRLEYGHPQPVSGAFAGRLGVAFAAEIPGGAAAHLLARTSLRQRSDVLFVASLLAVRRGATACQRRPLRDDLPGPGCLGGS